MKKELRERLASCMHEFAAVVSAIYAEPDGQEYVAKSACEYASGSILLADIGLSYTSDSRNTKAKVHPSAASCSIGMFAADGRTFKMLAFSDFNSDKPEDFNWNEVKFEETFNGHTVDSGILKETKYVEE